MRASSIRQPYAEEILRGMKTTEYRNRATYRIIKLLTAQEILDDECLQNL